MAKKPITPRPNPLNAKGSPEVANSKGLGSLLGRKGRGVTPFDDAAPGAQSLLTDRQADELYDAARFILPDEDFARLTQEKEESTALYLQDLAANVKPIFDDYVSRELQREEIAAPVLPVAEEENIPFVAAPSGELRAAEQPVAAPLAPASKSVFDGDPEVDELPGRGIEVPEERLSPEDLVEVAEPLAEMSDEELKATSERASRELNARYRTRVEKVEKDVGELRKEVAGVGSEVSAGLSGINTRLERMGRNYQEGQRSLEKKLNNVVPEAQRAARKAAIMVIKKRGKGGRDYEFIEPEEPQAEERRKTAVIPAVEQKPAERNGNGFFKYAAAVVVGGAVVLTSILSYDGCNKKAQEAQRKNLSDAVAPIVHELKGQREEAKKYSEDALKKQDDANKKVYEAWKRLSESSEAGIKSLGDRVLTEYETRTKQLTDKLGAGISDLDNKVTKYWNDIKTAQVQERKEREAADKQLKDAYENERKIREAADKQLKDEQDRLRSAYENESKEIKARVDALEYQHMPMPDSSEDAPGDTQPNPPQNPLPNHPQGNLPAHQPKPQDKPQDKPLVPEKLSGLTFTPVIEGFAVIPLNRGYNTVGEGALVGVEADVEVAKDLLLDAGLYGAFRVTKNDESKPYGFSNWERIEAGARLTAGTKYNAASWLTLRANLGIEGDEVMNKNHTVLNGKNYDKDWTRFEGYVLLEGGLDAKVLENLDIGLAGGVRRRIGGDGETDGEIGIRGRLKF